jgi:hypothetical protein
MTQALPRLALLLAACSQAPAHGAVIAETSIARADRARLVVEVEDDRAGPGRPMPLPARAIVTASDGSHPDGSGRGTYADGRFFADGRFAVEVPPGRTRVRLRSGPDYEPLELEAETKTGRETRLRARLHRWFAPEERGRDPHAPADAPAPDALDGGGGDPLRRRPGPPG